MTALLYDRIAQLEIELENQQSVVIQDLRISFTARMYNGEIANDADIQIYNLSEFTRSRIKEKNAVVNLKCGYARNTGLELLYRGEAQYIYHERSNGDVVTYLECQDGISRLRETNAVINFAGNTPVRIVLQKIADLFNVDVRFITEINDVYLLGYAFSGKLRDALIEVTERFGLLWSFQNGLLQIVRPGQDVDLDAILISAATGLIDTVNPIEYQGGDLNLFAESTRPVYKFQSLLRPKVIPASRVEISSLNVNGTFSVVNVVHNGDTRGEMWHSDIEVRNVLQ